jgi:signal peptidase I
VWTGVACYWKNTERHDLTDGTGDAHANDITVVDGVVYTAGYYSVGNDRIPCYWVNGQKYDLCAVPDYGEAMAIRVYDGKVYTAGRRTTADGKQHACYWVNQEWHDLYSTTSAYGAAANDIAVIGNTVYTCGDYHNGINSFACFWAGSTKYNLQDGGYNSYAESMYYDGSRFYIAGSYGGGRYTDSNACTFRVELNGDHALGRLPDSSTGSDSYAKDVWVSGNTVYAVGYNYFGGTYNYLFWKNGTLERLNFGAPEAICVTGEAIYLAGNNKGACYWKRNISSTLFSKTVLHENGSANAIFVVQ